MDTFIKKLKQVYRYLDVLEIVLKIFKSFSENFLETFYSNISDFQSNHF